MSAERRLHFESARTSLMQLTKQLQQEEDKVLQAQAAVHKRAKELDKQTEALAQEKQKMSAVGVADNDVLDLNVGGVTLSVKRATLTQVEGSNLASMFSGRWEDCLDHDSNGRVFLDFDPYSFQQILTMLRCRPFDLANRVVPPEAIITPDKLHAYKCLVDYLGLEGVCGAADQSSNLPSDACQLICESDNAFYPMAWPKGQRKPQAWAIPFLSSPGLADVVQQYFPFQMIVEPDGRSKVLPVTDIDKELFADKPDFVVI